MSIDREILNALVGIERFVVIGLLLIAVVGCLSAGDFFGAAVSALLATGLNACYMLMMRRKSQSDRDGSGTNNDSASTGVRTTGEPPKSESENIESLDPARA